MALTYLLYVMGSCFALFALYGGYAVVEDILHICRHNQAFSIGDKVLYMSISLVILCGCGVLAIMFILGAHSISTG